MLTRANGHSPFLERCFQLQAAGQIPAHVNRAQDSGVNGLRPTIAYVVTSALPTRSWVASVHSFELLSTVKIIARQPHKKDSPRQSGRSRPAVFSGLTLTRALKSSLLRSERAWSWESVQHVPTKLD